MGNTVSAWVDDETYHEILEREERTGKSKSKIASEYIRNGAPVNQNTKPTTDGGTPQPRFYESLGQGLFIAGFLVALLAPASQASGLGMSLIGLGLMLWTKIQTHMQAGETLPEATKTTLGLH